MNFKESVYWKIYGDIFAYHKKYAEPVRQDEFWDALVSEFSDIYGKYKEFSEGEFAKSLLLSIITEVERCDKVANTFRIRLLQNEQ